MADLICIAFKGHDTAATVLDDLRQMQKEYLIELADACVVTRDDKGELKLHQAVNLVAGGAAGGATWGALWGALLGLLFLNPLAGMAIGAAAGAGAGALGGALSDYGINDDFIKKVGELVCQGLLGAVHPGAQDDGGQGSGRTDQVRRHRPADLALHRTGAEAARGPRPSRLGRGGVSASRAGRR